MGVQLRIRDLSFDRSRFFRLHLLRDNARARYDLTKAAMRTANPKKFQRAFLFGCGRSGTSILGDLLATHPDVTYLYEPQGRWAMVDERTDMWHRYRLKTGGALLEAGDLNHRSIRRFQGMFRARTDLLLDKSPEHAFRLGFLAALDPSARFIHIVRDGWRVAASIETIAGKSYPIAGGYRYNLWWGLNDIKWRMLCDVAVQRRYIDEEVPRVSDDRERGLCEWLLSLNEVEVHRDALGDRLLHLKYDELVSDPGSHLARIAGFLGLEPEGSWLDRAAEMIVAPEKQEYAHIAGSRRLGEEVQRTNERWEL